MSQNDSGALPSLDAARLSDGVKRPDPIRIIVNGEALSCYPGETVATALLAGGVRIFRRSSGGQGRAPVCNMGVCFDCLVDIDGRPNQRSCMTRVADGMRIEAGGHE